LPFRKSIRITNFIVVKDRDLAEILKQAMAENLSAGVDLGIIFLYVTPLTELLAGGITTLSTDFKLMGKTMSRLLKNKHVETVDNPWMPTLRRSL
jgi:DNA-binding LacI/PurR family transcriptional regulator